MAAITRQLLSSKNGFVRKGAAAVLRLPKWWRSFGATPQRLAAAPPVLANSFPKSGTHLLYQIVDGLPDRVDFGSFLASMTSSFQFRPRSDRSVLRFVDRMTPGEIVRGHLFCEPGYASALRDRNVVHYFVYRDPRDVVVSEAHYLRSMNRWHRLHRHFARLASMDEAINMSITGFQPPIPGLEYPTIADRFARYRGWLDEADCLAIRYEDLVSERQPEIIREMAEFYARHAQADIDIESCARQMAAAVAPDRSHTFRSGKKAGWKLEFTPAHCRLFDQVAGQLLVDLDYEPNREWATAPAV
jgi:hypothetical protein